MTTDHPAEVQGENLIDLTKVKSAYQINKWVITQATYTHT